VDLQWSATDALGHPDHDGVGLCDLLFFFSFWGGMDLCADPLARWALIPTACVGLSFFWGGKEASVDLQWSATDALGHPDHDGVGLCELFFPFEEGTDLCDPLLKRV